MYYKNVLLLQCTGYDDGTNISTQPYDHNILDAIKTLNCLTLCLFSTIIYTSKILT